jgi:hypothetical protein
MKDLQPSQASLRNLRHPPYDLESCIATRILLLSDRHVLQAGSDFASSSFEIDANIPDFLFERRRDFILNWRRSGRPVSRTACRRNHTCVSCCIGSNLRWCIAQPLMTAIECSPIHLPHMKRVARDLTEASHR